MYQEEYNLRVNGADIHVVDRGVSFPVLVFLHYYGGSSRTWCSVIDGLSLTHRCIAIDFRGWGRSDKSQNDYDLDTLASDVDGVIAQFPLTEYILIGHSMGGKVAQIVAARQPKGLRGLILVAPAPPGPLDVGADQREAIIASYSSRSGVEDVLGLLTAMPLNDKLREQVIEDTLASPAAAKRAWPDQGMAKDIRGKAPSVKVPIRVIIGEKDGVETEVSLKAAFDESYPGTDYVIIPGAGHLSPLEAPEEVIHAIRTAPMV